MDEFNLKILTDIRCQIYVDGKYVGSTLPGVLGIFTLAKGEYWVQIISHEECSLKIEQVVTLEFDRILRANFKDLLQDDDIVFIKERRCYRNLRSNRDITDSIYDLGESFVGGIAKVYRNNMWGAIDKTGKEVVACQFLDPNLLFQLVVPFSYESVWECPLDERVTVYRNGYYGFIDMEGYEIIPCMYNNFSYFSDGLAVVQLKGKYGCINKMGEEVIPAVYSCLNRFNEDLAVVKRGDGWYVLDKQGNEVEIQNYENFGYYSSLHFHDGLLLVRKDCKWGYINKYGDETIPCAHDFAKNFSEGMALVASSSNKWGFVNMKGDLVIPCQYEKASSFNEGLALVMKNGKWGFVNKNGYEVIPCIYDDDGSSSSDDGYWDFCFHDGLALICKNKKYGFINKYGNEVVPCIYESAWPFRNGYARVSKSRNKSGIINIQGELVVEMEYSNSTDSAGGYAGVCKNGKWGLVNMSGKEIIPCIYNGVTSLGEGLVLIFKDEKYGLVKRKNGI